MPLAREKGMDAIAVINMPVEPHLGMTTTEKIIRGMLTVSSFEGTSCAWKLPRLDRYMKISLLRGMETDLFPDTNTSTHIEVSILESNGYAG